MKASRNLFLTVAFTSCSFVAAEAEQYNAREHNLRTQAQKIESATYHVSKTGFRITEIEDCILYDHQATFELGKASYRIHLDQVIFDLNAVESVVLSDSQTLRLAINSSSQALHSKIILTGKDVENLVPNFRIEALNQTLWESFLTNKNEQLVSLYREAAWDSSVRLSSIEIGSSEAIVWNFSKFHELRPNFLNSMLKDLHDLCRL